MLFGLIKDGLKLRITSILACLVALAGCNTMEYVDSQEVKQAYSSAERPGVVSVWQSDKQFGAVYLRNDTATAADDRMFLLKRDKGKYMAETSMFEGKQNDTFKRGYFAFGADKNAKSLGMQFRFEF